MIVVAGPRYTVAELANPRDSDIHLVWHHACAVTYPQTRAMSRR
jgi:hypothetical protein